MNEEEKRRSTESYEKAKSKGVPFFPDALFKDAVLSLVIFLVLVALAYFVGAPLEARANPADTTYTPRPEWYFLFLFQLLKYFPGRLEVIGVFILPTLAVVLLALLPFLDRSGRRNWRARPIVAALAAFAMVGIGTLTALAVLEAPPPEPATGGDPVAALYATNCAACHGASITVAPGANLHQIIAQGRHEGMPAWSADLTTDQIDALAGFILSPTGSGLFTQYCGACHEAPDLVAGDPVKLRDALDQGPDYPAHKGLDVPVWSDVLDTSQQTALLNFLGAPDGQRLFATNCSPCHGRSVAFSGDETALRAIIEKGGKHLEMPPWKERLTTEQIDTLAQYVVDPQASPGGAALFEQHCSTCHGTRVPAASTVEDAVAVISGGGAHQTMPVWGSILTPQQIDALTAYTLSASSGSPAEAGNDLFAKNCAVCHGGYGEGGPNPGRPGESITPISSAEFLSTRDDATLRAIISQGQPNAGMSPFGTANGGPLDDQDIDAIIAFMRTWETNPPVELPTQVAVSSTAQTGSEIFADICSQCHGPHGEGLVGPSLRAANFQANTTDQQILDTIRSGHPGTPMIGWAGILTSGQIDQLLKYIRQLGPTPTPGQATATPSAAAAGPSFSKDVMPILQSDCSACHGQMGGWDASSYDTVVHSGNNGPVVIAGDVAGSLLAQKLQGTQTVGSLMPPGGALPQDQIQVILDWIAAGAPNN